ncbi:MAG: ISAs1 family transposase [Planctomycetales bacterium]|nr:ISAs1 family transposase [Planctomycetales bacterium]
MHTGPAGIVYKHFEKVTDPRAYRGPTHDLHEMIFMALTATMCGANGWADVERFVDARYDWFERYIPMENGVPSHDTFGRIFAKLDTGEFLSAMHGWADEFAGSLRNKGVAIDGKLLRGSFDTASGKSAVHTITAFAVGTRTVLRQMFVDAKSNEIPAVPVLLKLLDLAGAIVTLDAMHCQTETAQAIIDAEADYILSVKGNQQNLYKYLLNKFVEFAETDFSVEGLRRLITREKSHGRIERRTYYAIAVSDEDRTVLKRWPGLQSVGMVVRERTIGEKDELETSFFITSHVPKVRALADHIRGHWSIENSQHYVLDVTFAEDSSRIRSGTAPQISSSIRRMALNILQRDKSVKDNIRGKRLRAGWDETVLDKIWAAFSTN